MKRPGSRTKVPSTINNQPSTCLPVALTIAGSDSSAGAGIQADLKAFSVFDVYGLSAVTCVVAETPGKVSRIEPVSPDMVRAQVEVVTKSFPVAAIKTGLLCTRANISAVAQSIAYLQFRGPIVVDPVITATGGDSLLERGAIDAYEKELFPVASLITPNLDEASQLLGRKVADRESMERAGRELNDKFKTAVLLKGGHLQGDNALDLLFTDGRIAEFSTPFIRDVATHGTGCTYSAAITAELAKGAPLVEAITRAKDFVTKCISNRLRWSGSSGDIDALRHDRDR